MRRIAEPLQPHIERQQTKLMRWQPNTNSRFRNAKARRSVSRAIVSHIGSIFLVASSELRFSTG
jgi:hypothetical protein